MGVEAGNRVHGRRHSEQSRSGRARISTRTHSREPLAPGDITLEKAQAWSHAGINRVSLGVQSFVEREIRRTGRKHTAQIVANEVAILRDAGVRSVNVDLIAGLSAQTTGSWEASLDWIERIAPEH